MSQIKKLMIKAAKIPTEYCDGRLMIPGQKNPEKRKAMTERTDK